MPSPTGYSRIQIRLHWIVALLILMQFVLHDYISDAWGKIARGLEFEPNLLIASHVFGGIAILALVLWRLWIRIKRGAPHPPEQEHPALKLVAHAAHWLFYVLLILLPFSGMAAWFGGVRPAAEAHEVLKTVLLALIVLHVLGALYHQFILKTNLMMRMKRPDS